MHMIEAAQPLGRPMTIEPHEKVCLANVSVMLINMEGEKDMSLHEPIGLESIAGRLTRDIPGIKLGMYDAQPELLRTGKLNTDRLATRIREFVDNPTTQSAKTVLGIGIPIYSWSYTEALLIKLEQDPPKKPLEIVFGNAIPTYTKPELLKKKFPHVKLVVGEGEDVFSTMVQKVAKGEEIEDSMVFMPPNLRDYTQPLRIFTTDIIDLGGSAKAESSRGCDFGTCTFCSRCVRGGKDYRTVQEEEVATSVRNLIDTFNVTRFEFTDEEAFGDTEATARLISVLKSSDLPRIPFVASLRVSTLNKLHEEELLSQLQEMGLDKVFLGVEGGSNRFFKQIGKGQNMDNVRQAMQTTIENGVDMEIGFITFSWRMDIDMLRENIEFLSEGNNAEYVSSLFNLLEVRAGSLDETLLRKYVEKGIIRGYDPDKQFSINNSYYQNVPFIDEAVGKIYEDVKSFADADASLYYSLKSASRAASLNPDTNAKVKWFYLQMKELHLKYLRNAVGLEEDLNVWGKRHNLVEKMKVAFCAAGTERGLGVIQREITAFLLEETERKEVTGDQTGAMAVCLNEKGQILLVRPRNQELWAFPGGNVKDGEENTAAAIREGKEELGVQDVTILDALPEFTKENHVDHTTGKRPRLTLYHFLAKIEGDVNIQDADHEIADILWLSPEDIMCGRVQTRENVSKIAQFIIDQKEKPGHIIMHPNEKVSV